MAGKKQEEASCVNAVKCHLLNLLKWRMLLS